MVQLEVELVGVTTRQEECAGPENPVAAILEFRAENVGQVATEEPPQFSYYWISEDSRRVDAEGCFGDEPELSGLAPGQYSEGFERIQVPDEPGSLVFETAYPFVNSVVELPAA